MVSPEGFFGLSEVCFDQYEMENQKDINMDG